MVAAGVYMPEKEQLLAIRRMLLDRHEEYRALIGSKRLTAVLDQIDGMKMTRGPKGFSRGSSCNGPRFAEAMGCMVEVAG